MVSVPSTHLVLFIASVAVAASVAGAFTAEASRLSETFEEVGLDQGEAVDTDIAIVTDPGRPVYDVSTSTITLHVLNLGESTPAHGEEHIDVFLDGEYQPSSSLTVTLQGASSWAPDEVVRIDIETTNLAWGDHRLKVAVDGDEEVFEFRNCYGVPRDTVAFQLPNGNLAIVDRSGVVTDLGVGNDLMAFGPAAADYDCDGLLEVPYVVGNDFDGQPGVGNTPEWEALRVIDASGQTQTLHTWPGGQDSTVGARLGVGDLDGDGVPEVTFPDPEDGDDLYRVEVGENPSEIGSGYEGLGVGGLGDFNGDDDLDLVYLETSNNDLVYLEDQTEFGTGVVADGSFTIGSPMDFDGDGQARVPIIEADSGEVALVDDTGTTETLDPATSGAVGSLASIDWNDDGTPDVVWVNSADNDYLYYTELDGTTTRITDENGDPVQATDLGVA